MDEDLEASQEDVAHEVSNQSSILSFFKPLAKERNISSHLPKRIETLVKSDKEQMEAFPEEENKDGKEKKTRVGKKAKARRNADDSVVPTLIDNEKSLSMEALIAGTVSVASKDDSEMMQNVIPETRISSRGETDTSSNCSKGDLRNIDTSFSESDIESPIKKKSKIKKGEREEKKYIKSIVGKLDEVQETSIGEIPNKESRLEKSCASRSQIQNENCMVDSAGKDFLTHKNNLPNEQNSISRGTCTSYNENIRSADNNYEKCGILGQNSKVFEHDETLKKISDGLFKYQIEESTQTSFDIPQKGKLRNNNSCFHAIEADEICQPEAIVILSRKVALNEEITIEKENVSKVDKRNANSGSFANKFIRESVIKKHSQFVPLSETPFPKTSHVLQLTSVEELWYKTSCASSETQCYTFKDELNSEAGLFLPSKETLASVLELNKLIPKQTNILDKPVIRVSQCLDEICKQHPDLQIHQMLQQFLNCQMKVLKQCVAKAEQTRANIKMIWKKEEKLQTIIAISSSPDMKQKNDIRSLFAKPKEPIIRGKKENNNCKSNETICNEERVRKRKKRDRKHQPSDLSDRPKNTEEEDNIDSEKESKRIGTIKDLFLQAKGKVAVKQLHENSCDNETSSTSEKAEQDGRRNLRKTRKVRYYDHYDEQESVDACMETKNTVEHLEGRGVDNEEVAEARKESRKKKKKDKKKFHATGEECDQIDEESTKTIGGESCQNLEKSKKKSKRNKKQVARSEDQVEQINMVEDEKSLRKEKKNKSSKRSELSHCIENINIQSSKDEEDSATELVDDRRFQNDIRVLFAKKTPKYNESRGISNTECDEHVIEILTSPEDFGNQDKSIIEHDIVQESDESKDEKKMMVDIRNLFKKKRARSSERDDIMSEEKKFQTVKNEASNLVFDFGNVSRTQEADSQSMSSSELYQQSNDAVISSSSHHVTSDKCFNEVITKSSDIHGTNLVTETQMKNQQDSVCNTISSSDVPETSPKKESCSIEQVRCKNILSFFKPSTGRNTGDKEQAETCAPGNKETAAIACDNVSKTAGKEEDKNMFASTSEMQREMKDENFLENSAVVLNKSNLNTEGNKLKFDLGTVIPDNNFEKRIVMQEKIFKEEKESVSYDELKKAGKSRSKRKRNSFSDTLLSDNKSVNVICTDVLVDMPALSPSFKVKKKKKFDHISEGKSGDEMLVDKFAMVKDGVIKEEQMQAEDPHAAEDIDELEIKPCLRKSNLDKMAVVSDTIVQCLDADLKCEDTCKEKDLSARDERMSDDTTGSKKSCIRRVTRARQKFDGPIFEDLGSESEKHQIHDNDGVCTDSDDVNIKSEESVSKRSAKVEKEDARNSADFPVIDIHEENVNSLDDGNRKRIVDSKGKTYSRDINVEETVGLKDSQSDGVMTGLSQKYTKDEIMEGRETQNEALSDSKMNLRTREKTCHSDNEVLFSHCGTNDSEFKEFLKSSTTTPNEVSEGSVDLKKAKCEEKPAITASTDAPENSIRRRSTRVKEMKEKLKETSMYVDDLTAGYSSPDKKRQKRSAKVSISSNEKLKESTEGMNAKNKTHTTSKHDSKTTETVKCDQEGHQNKLGTDNVLSDKDRSSKMSADEEPVTEETVNTQLLWTEKYAPIKHDDVIGNAESVKRLFDWLFCWKERHEHIVRRLALAASKNTKSGRAKNKDEDDSDFSESSEEEDDLSNTFVIIGKVGCGTTSAVYACAQELGYEVLELNPAKHRPGKQIQSLLGEATQSHQVKRKFHGTSIDDKGSHDDTSNGMKSLSSLFGCSSSVGRVQKSNEGDSKRDLAQDQPISTCSIKSDDNMSLILLEQADIIFDDHDKGFWFGVNELRSQTKRPIIITANDSSVTNQLDGGFIELINMDYPSKMEALVRLQVMCVAEQVYLSAELIEKIFTCCKADLRQSILQLQFWLEHWKSPMYKVIDLKQCKLMNGTHDKDPKYTSKVCTNVSVSQSSDGMEAKSSSCFDALTSSQHCAYDETKPNATDTVSTFGENLVTGGLRADQLTVSVGAKSPIHISASKHGTKGCQTFTQNDSRQSESGNGQELNTKVDVNILPDENNDVTVSLVHGMTAGENIQQSRIVKELNSGLETERDSLILDGSGKAEEIKLHSATERSNFATEDDGNKTQTGLNVCDGSVRDPLINIIKSVGQPSHEPGVVDIEKPGLEQIFHKLGNERMKCYHPLPNKRRNTDKKIQTRVSDLDLLAASCEELSNMNTLNNRRKVLQNEEKFGWWFGKLRDGVDDILPIEYEADQNEAITDCYLGLRRNVEDVHALVMKRSGLNHVDAIVKAPSHKRSVSNVLSHVTRSLPLATRMDHESLSVDIIAYLKSICLMEETRRLTQSKRRSRRFLHYLDAIQLYLDEDMKRDLNRTNLLSINN